MDISTRGLATRLAVSAQSPRAHSVTTVAGLHTIRAVVLLASQSESRARSDDKSACTDPVDLAAKQAVVTSPLRVVLIIREIGPKGRGRRATTGRQKAARPVPHLRHRGLGLHVLANEQRRQSAVVQSIPGASN